MALQDFTLNLKANTLALDKSIKSVTSLPTSPDANTLYIVVEA